MTLDISPRLLGQISQESTLRAGTNLSSSPVMGVDSKIGMTTQTRYQSEDLSRYKVLNPRAFAYNPMRLNIGSIGFLPQSESSALVSPDYVVFECGPELLPEFLHYYTKTASWRDWVSAAGTGSVRSRIYFKELARMPMMLPPLPVQVDAVNVLQGLDALESEAIRENALLESTAREVFRAWFINFETTKAKAKWGQALGVDQANFALIPSTFHDSELGPIPNGWRVSTIGSICENIRSRADPAAIDEQTPYVGLEHVPRFSLALLEKGVAAGLESNKAWFCAGDILFGKLRPNLHKVVVAPCAGVCSTDILVIRPLEPAFLPFAALQLSSTDMVDYATRLSNGAKMPRTSWSDISAYKIVTAPNDVMEAFSQCVSPLLHKLIANADVIKAVQQIRELLLPRLISGKIALSTAFEDVGLNGRVGIVGNSAGRRSSSVQCVEAG
jgi:type I restriction enzyme S subunit